MADVQQQKPGTSGVNAEFECELEELMRGHLDDCLSFPSCSSPSDPNEEDYDGDQLARRRNSDVEADSLAESSSARRCHSRILSRWAARQAQEMITTIERRNRESELMALSGLQTVSMLDSSFLRESQSPTSMQQSTDERPSNQASTILQMWRELEEEHLLNRAHERVRRRLRRQTSAETNENVLSTNTSLSLSSENQGSMDSENGFGNWENDRVELQTQYEDNSTSSREQSPDLGEHERERVRQILRGWVESGITDQSSNVSQRNNNTRAELLGETERERVRVIREWMQLANQQRGSLGGRRDEQIAGLDAQVDRVRDGLVVEHGESQPEHIRRDLLRLRGRQAVIDLLMRIDRERQRELQGLLEHRAVSDFAHRNRIQSFLRGRFLQGERPATEERPPSNAASELVQLRQRHTVSGLREAFRSRLENIVRGQAGSHSDDRDNDIINASGGDQTQANTSVDLPLDSEHSLPVHQGIDTDQLTDQIRNLDSDISIDHSDQQETRNQRGELHELITENERENLQQSIHAQPAVRRDGDWEGNFANSFPLETDRDEGEPSYMQETQRIWHEAGSGEVVENLTDESSNSGRFRHTYPHRRHNRSHPPDDDNVYSIELRELLSRRSVSNLLHSDFRESLDQLIQSYVERQGRAPIDWDFQRNFSNPVHAPLAWQDQVHRRDEEDEEEGDISRPPVVQQSPPVPPPQPLWHHDINQSSWSRHSMHRSILQWEMVNDMRADMTRLQQGMNHMQRMLEACMDMQLELQRSVRQEVAAALNHSVGEEGMGAETSEYGSKWGHVGKGTCCICCDSSIDSLLYRCGHMCTCLKCAMELVRGGGKCPLCRAPIIEVIRAYSVV